MEYKWGWAGHLARRKDGRWSKALTKRKPMGKRKQGRPRANRK